MRYLFCALLGSALISGCASSSPNGADIDGGSDVADASTGTPDASRAVDASLGEQFDHYTIVIEPDLPIATHDFTVTVTAYASSSQAQRLSYDGTISLSASAGVLSGDVNAAAIVGGIAMLTVQLDSPQSAVTLTVTDDSDMSMSSVSEPFDVAEPGTEAALRDVVINEVNWSGNDGSSTDEWIELRNATGGDINLTGWKLENGGLGGSPDLSFPVGTMLSAGGYLVLGRMQGPDSDGMRTSLTGVSNVLLMTVGLGNGGEELHLVDPSGDVIDTTPTGEWPAGINDVDYSMERRDDLSGGGYGDGAQAGSWYTWSSLDGTDTTHSDSSDRGTPGAANTNPAIFDHLVLTTDPAQPRADLDFTLTVTAYSSSDDSTVIDTYDGLISVAASAGSLSGQVSGQPITAGTATLILQNGSVNTGVELTATDDIYPHITGSVVVDIRPEGDTAGTRDVVINEVNYYGNGSDSGDEWIELRNISGAALNLSGWTIDGAGVSSNAVTLDSGTVLADGAYLVIAAMQGPDLAGQRTSVTGVSPTQIQSLSLLNGGEQLTLRDVLGTAIDQTPAGSWPAGDAGLLISMERRDDITGGGYSDGSVAGAWGDWNSYDGVDTTNAETADHGTPGAANSDPAAYPPPLSLPYATGFEQGQPNFENLATGGFANAPPTGTAARNGSGVMTSETITISYTSRQIQSIDCIVLNNGIDPVILSLWATASTGNGGNALIGRFKVLWFDDPACATPNATSAQSAGSGVGMPQGSYAQVTASLAPPSGATHIKVRFELHDDNGAPNDGDAWAADDVSVTQ